MVGGRTPGFPESSSQGEGHWQSWERNPGVLAPMLAPASRCGAGFWGRVLALVCVYGGGLVGVG